MILLGLGSSRNGRWGSPADTLARCIQELQKRGFRITAVSSTYETKGVGPGRPGTFANAVVAGESHLSPEALLRAIKQLERRAGGRSAMPWGPRTLDIDILCYKKRILGWSHGLACKNTPGKGARPFSLPHAALHLRPFVLAPLLEICPRWRHPVLQKSVVELWRRVATSQKGKILSVKGDSSQSS